MSEELPGGIDTVDVLKKKPHQSAGAELIIPVAGTVFALYYFTTIWNSPWTAQVSAFFIGSILILCSIAVTIRIIGAIKRGEATFNFTLLIEPRDFIVKRVILFFLILAYIIVVQWAGFTLTTFAFLFLAMALLNERKRLGLITVLSATLAIGGWLLFVVAFAVRFPAGPFETLMKGIM
ncbi:MAG: hypothetical protein ACI82H_000009 [Alphaproteobacteria bacterium]|jgi:hypothetical protein